MNNFLQNDLHKRVGEHMVNKSYPTIIISLVDIKNEKGSAKTKWYITLLTYNFTIIKCI